MSTILERIASFAQKKQIPIGGIERQIGASKGVLSRAIQNDTDIQAKWLQKLVENFPDCSGQWLLTGRDSIEELSDRISEIYNDLANTCYEEGEYIARAFGVSQIELANFTTDYSFPSKPFDLVKFIRTYPEYNYVWILTGVGAKFTGEEEECIQSIKDRTYKKNHPEFFPNFHMEEEQPDDSLLWKQIAFQNEQLKEKDAQIREKDAQIKEKDAQFKQLLDFLHKK